SRTCSFSDGTKESTIETFQNALNEHKIEVEFGSEVESVKNENGVFLVSTGKGVYECKNIIVAIGRMGKPNKPDYKLPIT
ncbi:NAD(P)-binding domain-containing protein, partial [Listeria monocytogenes]